MNNGYSGTRTHGIEHFSICKCRKKYIGAQDEGEKRLSLTGFEFGILPHEHASLLPPALALGGNFSRQLLFADDFSCRRDHGTICIATFAAHQGQSQA